MNKDPKILYQANSTTVRYLRSDLTLRGAVLQALEMLPWANKKQIQLWVRGVAPRRDSGIELELKRLTRKRSVHAVPYAGRSLAYSLKKRTDRRFYGFEEVTPFMGNSECLVRFHRSDVNAVPISERAFKGRGFGVVPEGGFLYPNGNLLLVEFSTPRDFMLTRKLDKKIMAYRQNLEKIREAYHAKTAFVVFIVDIPRDTVARLVDDLSSRAEPGDHFYFTDYETFKKVELTKATQAEIYFYMDGKEYPLA